MEWERYWRVLLWNRLASCDFEESATIAAKCRTAWRQIGAVVPADSSLPNSLLYPLIGYRKGERVALDLFHDDRRLTLYMSDLRDYLQLMRIQGKVEGLNRAES